MVGALGARLRPALCIIFCLSARLGIRPEGKRGFASMPPFLNAYLTMDWFRRLGLPSRCGRKQAIDLPGDTLWVDGRGRAPNDSPFRVCAWSVVGKGVLIRAKLTGPAQS
eukprot:6320563-Amphidinium_carterae.1